ncbi:hypothetical protein GKE82_26445 [Conexibacter sp. W3-3-2]|nr:hypothetical protein [Conexibacter sp. W3-3-2]
MPREMQVARNLLARLGANPGLGAEVGRRHRLPTMGVWGFVVLTSASVGDAIQVGLRYVHLSSAFLRPEVRPEADVLRILLHEDDPGGCARVPGRTRAHRDLHDHRSDPRRDEGAGRPRFCAARRRAAAGARDRERRACAADAASRPFHPARGRG